MGPANVNRNILAEQIAERAFSQPPKKAVKAKSLDVTVSLMLETLSLETLKPIFAEEDLTIEDISKLSRAELREIGIKRLKDRIAILHEAESIVLSKKCLQNLTFKGDNNQNKPAGFGGIGAAATSFGGGFGQKTTAGGLFVFGAQTQDKPSFSFGSTAPAVGGFGSSSNTGGGLHGNTQARRQEFFKQKFKK